VNRRPLLATTAAVGAVVLVASAGSAGAATALQPAVGRAVSSVAVLQLSAAGHSLRLVDINLISDTLDGTLSAIEVVPVTADGTKLGRQVLTPSDGAKSIAAVSSPGALSPVVSVTSPAIQAAATNQPTATAGATSLGSVNLFSLPLSIAGEIVADSGVLSSAGAAGQKTVTVEDVALPSIADLLGKLGLDLGALPIGTLNDLINQLNLATGAVTTAQGVVDSAQAQLDAAVADLATQAAALSSAQATLASATSAVDDAADGVQALLDTVLPTGMLLADYVALADPAKALIDATVSGLAAAYQQYLSAQTALAAAQTAVTTAQGLVDTAQALVTTLTDALDDVVATLTGLIEGVLDGTPLVSLSKLAVTTVASVTSAKAGGQTARVVGGEVSGLQVLGTDVLETVLGSTTVDLSDLTGSALTQVNDAIATLNGTLSEVLSNVPSLPALSVPTPVVELLTKSTSTSVEDGFGNASAIVKGLSIRIPGLTVPSAVQVPNALSLPGISAAGASSVASQAVNLNVLTLSEQATFRPATTSGSTTGGRTLPNTGPSAALALTAMALIGTAVALRRRFLVSG